MPPPSSHEGRRPSGSISQPWLSEEADSSNPETLHDIPLGDFQSGPANYSPKMPEAHTKIPRESMDSTNPRTSGTAQRLAELRAEMKANQEQIQQLSEAHRAVQNAVSGINATQELLSVAPMHGTGTIVTGHVYNPNSNTNSCKSRAMRFNGMQAREPQLAGIPRPQASRTDLNNH